MKQQLFIDITDQETRVAVLQDERLAELYVERGDEQFLVGNIYKGKVTRVLPGMQAAFIDIGQQRTGFLHARDVFPSGSSAGARRTAETGTISELVHEGQTIVVQVIKDPIAEKGARLTTDISIASRNLVYLERGKGVAISKKIDNEPEIERLNRLLECWVGEPSPTTMTGGFIVRTQAQDVAEEQLFRDFQYLKRAWLQMQQRLPTAGPGELLYADLPLLLRSVRDYINTTTQSALINCPKAFARAQQFTQEMLPNMAAKMVLYQAEQPLFSVNDIESQIQTALSPSAALPSGGNLVIEQTEAMVTIDINSGSNTGSSTHTRHGQNVAYLTNKEASIEIARQIRLRNLSGMIIIDFIDMHKSEHKKAVLQTLLNELKRDPVRVEVGEMSRLGLVELTRKRTFPSWQQILCEPCPTCAGHGRVKSAETVCYEIYREIANTASKLKPPGFTIVAAPAVVERLTDSRRGFLTKLEKSLACSIQLVSEPHYLPSQFDLALI